MANDSAASNFEQIFETYSPDTVRQVSRDVAYYNLQLIIAAGFKMNNQRAVQFRKWAGKS